LLAAAFVGVGDSLGLASLLVGLGAGALLLVGFGEGDFSLGVRVGSTVAVAGSGLSSVREPNTARSSTTPIAVQTLCRANQLLR
jgi:hypothetical protein